MHAEPTAVLKILSDPTRRAIFERLSKGGEMTVHAVVFGLGHDVGLRDRNLLLDALVRLTLNHHVATELTRDYDQRAIQQPAPFEVKD